MRAKLHRMAGDYSKATANFLVALEQLSRILCDSRMESRYEPFFEDLAIHLRESKAQLLEDYLRRVQDGRIRGRMRLILGMTNSDFEGWVHAYLPTATFHDGRFNLPVP
jgi:uncharacterized heparinase superfamily protein